MSVTPLNNNSGMVRVTHPDLPHGYADGCFTTDGLFVTRREGAGWLWDVWASIEAFCTQRNNPAALVAGNLTLSAAVEWLIEHEGGSDA